MTLRVPTGFLAVFSVLLGGFMFHGSAASAQEIYTAWQTDEGLAAQKTEVISNFKSGNRGSDPDKFFDGYYFARWTNPANMGQVQTYARELINQDLKEARGNARDYFLTKTLTTLQKMAADQSVTPAARLNAVLTIGQLNQQEAASRSTPPVPYAPALPYLVQEYEKKDNPEYIRISALNGIVRHAILGITDATLRDTAVPNLFIETIQSNKPAPGRNKESQEMLDWYRLRALEGLGFLKSVGAGGRVVEVLVEVMENSQETIELRARAARTLGELDFKAAIESQVTINFQRLGTLLVSLAKASCDTDLHLIREQQEKERAEGTTGSMRMGGMEMGGMDGMGGMGGGMFGGMPGGRDYGIPFASLTPEKQQVVIAAVQRIKTNIMDIVFGMRGDRLTGVPTEGIVSVMTSEDPIAVKMNQTAREIDKLFKILDDGPPEQKMRPGMATGDYMGSGMPPGVGGAKRPQPGRDSKQPTLKVNLTIIHDEIQKTSTALEKIISGAG